MLPMGGIYSGIHSFNFTICFKLFTIKIWGWNKTQRIDVVEKNNNHLAYELFVTSVFIF